MVKIDSNDAFIKTFGGRGYHTDRHLELATSRSVIDAVHLPPLQSVLNAAARLVLKLRKFDRVSISATIRNELHWLSVHKRIVYKLCLLVFKCQHEQATIYLSSLFAAVSCHNPSSAAGGNPRRPRLPANKNCHIRLTGCCSF